MNQLSFKLKMFNTYLKEILRNQIFKNVWDRGTNAHQAEVATLFQNP